LLSGDVMCELTYCLLLPKRQRGQLFSCVGEYCVCPSFPRPCCLVLFLGGGGGWVSNVFSGVWILTSVDYGQRLLSRHFCIRLSRHPNEVLITQPNCLYFCEILAVTGWTDIDS